MSAEIPDGAVLVARGILNSSLWTMRPEDRIVAMTCIMLCNRRRKKWFDGDEDVTIERGQFVRSREKLAEACHLPLQVVRTSLDHLESSDFLTRRSTRWWTMYTLPKYQHYQDLTKYSDIVDAKTNPVANPSLTTNNNNKPYPPSKSKTDRTDRKTLGREGFVVVVDQKTWADPVLSKPSYRLSLKLLDEIKMARGVANTFAIQKPVGFVLRVVSQAKFQRSPAGWARIAFENDWSLPEAPAEDVEKTIAIIKDALEYATSLTTRNADTIKEKFPKKPGETDDQWFKRASHELVASKKGAKKA